MTTPESLVDQAVAEGGAYEVLRARLLEQGARLRGLAEGLNQQRLAEFGSSELKIIGRLRVRTEHNAVARDLVRVGDFLLFGYNVFLGLKRETQVSDVFALYRLVEAEGGFDVEPVELASSFLGAQGFVQDFRELYAYYKNTRLLQLVARDGLLLAAFQIGERLSDVRVFRFSVSPAGEVRYVDNRGERDIALPPIHDFEWTRCGREHVVEGRFPHMNEHVHVREAAFDHMLAAAARPLEIMDRRRPDHQDREQHRGWPRHLPRAGRRCHPEHRRRAHRLCPRR
jgi:hypothetical protein